MAASAPPPEGGRPTRDAGAATPAVAVESMLPAEPVRPIGYADLLRTNAAFRHLWFGQIASLLGDWFNLIASAALVARFTDSAIAVGGLFVVRMLAPFLVSPLAGVVADRYHRKQILVAVDLFRAVIVLGFLLVRDESLVWLLYVLTACQLAGSGFFFSARNALLPDIVAPRALGTANAISSVTWSVMLAVGAATGGLVSSALGIYPAFIIDSLTFFLSAWLISRMRVPREAHEGNRSLAAVFGEYVEGLNYLWRHREASVVVLHKAALTLLFGPTLNVVYVAIAERIFPLGQGSTVSLGLMFAAGGVGTGLGPLAARWLTHDRPGALRMAIVAGYLVGGLGVVIASPLTNLPLTLAGFLLAGMGNGIVWVFSTQLLMQAVAGRVRGRIFATEFAFFTLASAAGATLVGLALDRQTPIAAVLSIMAALSLVPAAVWAAWLVNAAGRAQQPETTGDEEKPAQ